MADKKVTYERVGKIAYITFNRPERRNAVTLEMQQQLADAFRAFDYDDDAWVAVLSGNGSDFCLGIDVRERFHETSRAERDGLLSAGPPTDGHLGRTANWKPVISAVHGLAVGLGFNLVLESDLVVAATDTEFMIAESKRGIAAGQLWAKMQTFMPSKIMTELLLFGDRVPATKLEPLGFINRLTEPGKHVAAAEELAYRLLELPPLAVRAHVRITRWQWNRYSDEAALYIQPLKLHLTKDFEEASTAFVEKRAPEFTGH